MSVLRVQGFYWCMAELVREKQLSMTLVYAHACPRSLAGNHCVSKAITFLSFLTTVSKAETKLSSIITRKLQYS